MEAYSNRFKRAVKIEYLRQGEGDVSGMNLLEFGVARNLSFRNDMVLAILDSPSLHTSNMEHSHLPFV
jgi:hypothetical protein